MKYIQFVNEQIRKRVARAEYIVLYGQNVSAGSCIGGLTRNLKTGKGGCIINTPNSENTLTGAGFGMMLGGVDSIFFMKQLDFLLLGMDHLVNTWNFIRTRNPKASFTIVPVIVDLGYQGMQSSFNNLGDMCSTARIKGYTVTNLFDTEKIISTQLVSPGFRIIGVSQRLRDNPHIGHDLHEVGISHPARHHMRMDMVVDPGTGGAAKVDADIETLRVKNLF